MNLLRQDKQILKSIQQQEKWRQKQIRMLYYSGRPLFKQEHVPGPIFPSFLLNHSRFRCAGSPRFGS